MVATLVVAGAIVVGSDTFSSDVTAPNATYPVNANVGATIDAYANSDVRTMLTMDPTTRAVSGSSGSATGAATSKITAIKLTKSEPSPENELVRGVHDHVTIYNTLKATPIVTAPTPLGDTVWFAANNPWVVAPTWETPSGDLGGTVWFDVNNDGVQDSGEPGIAGVWLTITDAGSDGFLGTADDNISDPTTTVSDGTYLFTDLPLHGSYRVTVDTTTLPAGMAETYDVDGLDSANTATITSFGASRSDVDFGYRGVGSIGGLVWLDRNTSGTATADTGEPGLPGIPVTVTWSGPDRILGTADDISLPTDTDATGRYLVPNLPFGPYSVVVDTASRAFPEGVFQTFDADGTGTPNASTTTLSVGTPEVLTQDFSYAGTASLGGQVWLDTQANGDGTFDAATDRALPGVAIVVTYVGLDAVEGGGDDMAFSTTTAADGTYQIDGLPLGAYTVAATPPVTLTQTFDSDGLRSVSKSAVSLTADVPVDLLQDFSYTGTASIGDVVWHDRNAAGVLDPGEEGIGGVTVTSTWVGPDGTFGTPDDIVLPTVATAPDGTYLFPNLPAGSYRVVIDPATVPAGYVSTYDVDGSDLKSSTVTLALGEARRDVDFGLREIADLIIVESHPAGGVDPGGVVTFRITVTNLGPGTARKVEVVDTVPADLTIDTVTQSGWTCTTTGQSIVCDLDTDLLADGVVYFDVTTTATVAAAPGVVNIVTVTSDTPDVVPTNNRSVDSVQVDVADLSITKSLRGGKLVADGMAEYVLTVSNKGPSSVPVGKVIVTDPLPVQLTGVSATSTDFDCTITGQNVVCTNKAVYTAGTTSTISIKVKVAKVGTSVSVPNTAHVTGGFVDPTPDDEVDSATFTLGPLPSTGSPVTWPYAVGTLALFVAGGVLLLVARRRRRTQA